jgi:hypothetical protein
METKKVELIDKIKTDNLIAAKTTFKDVMSQKVIDKLEQLKKDIGSNLYKNREEK